MSEVETITVFISIVGTVIATGAAYSAKLSANAARDQAASASKQADHAEAQAKAAKQQVSLMREGTTFEGISRLSKARRMVINSATALDELTIFAKRGNDGNAIAKARDNLESILNQIEDATHLFPPQMWKPISQYVEAFDADIPILIRQAGDKAIIENLTLMGDRLRIAMEIEIGRRWATIDPATAPV